MKKRLIRSLSRLASFSYQEAYIVNASKEEYVLPEDIVEDVASIYQIITRRHSDLITKQQQEKLQLLYEEIKKLGADFWQKKHFTLMRDFVLFDTQWIKLRTLSQECLISFNIDINKIAFDEIDGRLII